MEKLWSPWRSQYIDSFKQAKKPDGCILCEISKENIDDEKSMLVDKSELTFSIMNLYPYNNGHMMIIPYRHIDDVTKLTDDENLEIMKKLQVALKALKEVMNPEGFNMGANIGRVAGAGIYEHIHFHIVPRWNGDTNFMPVLGEVKVISQDLLETKKNIIDVYKKYNF